MKRSGNRLKGSLSNELSYNTRMHSKLPSTQRSIDTKFLFKNDHLKELSKFAFNPSSRDVSHIRDRLSSSLPKLIPSLPTNFDHLKQLYYSSDPLGMPYSVSASNLVSSLSCKKQSCVEKVLTTHNSVAQEDFTPQSIERLNLGNPTGRQDIQSLQIWLKDMKDNNLEMLQRDYLSWDLETIDKAEIVYVIAGKELIRQVSVHCIERGEVLKEILWFFSTVFKAQKNQYMRDLREKIEKIQKEIDEKVYRHARQIAQYEIVVQKKCEKIEGLKEENEKLNQMLQKTQISLIKLQNSQELRGGIFKMSPVVHISSSEKQKEATTEIKKENSKVTTKNEIEKKSEKIETVLNSEIKKPKERKNLSDETKLVTINEILHLVLEDNEKITQTDEEEQKSLAEESTQTEKLAKKPKQKFDFRTRQIDSKSRRELDYELLSQFSILPKKITQTDTPDPIILTPVDNFCSFNFQKTLKTYEEELKQLENAKKSWKRTSLLSPLLPPLSKISSRNSPLGVPETQTRQRKMSQQVILQEDPESDVLIANVMIKQKAYNDLAETIKGKKSELKNITAEIEDKQNRLNRMKNELQLKQAEIQASKTGLSLDVLRQKILAKVEQAKANKKEEQLEGLEENELGELGHLISSNFDVSSWKAGFNAGFEKGVAVGFRQGEELGIEVGEDQGYMKVIQENQENSDSKSDSSGSDSDKEDDNEQVLNEKPENSDSNLKETEEKPQKNLEVKKRVERHRKTQISLNSISSILPETKDEFALGSGKQFKTHEEIPEALKRSTTMSNSIKPKFLKKQATTNKDQILSKFSSIDLNSSKDLRSVKRSYSVESSTKIPQETSSKPAKHSKQDRKETEKLTSKGLTALQSPSEDLKYPQRSQQPSKTEKFDPLNKKPEKIDLKSKFKNEKTFNKRQTLANKDLITIVINKENPDPGSERKEDSSVESNRLAIHTNRSRKLSISSKNSRSENEDFFSGNEDVSDAEVRNRYDNSAALRKRIREVTKFHEFNFHSRVPQLVKKTNPASKIVEKFLQKNLDRIIRRSKMSKRMAFRFLNSIYQSFYSKGRFADNLLVEHVYDEFLQKYSVKTVCEKKLKEFLAALLKNSASKRSLMFLRLTNISEKMGIRGYSQQSVVLYMQALNFILTSKVGIIIAVDETADQIMIPVARAVECAKELFEGKFEKNFVNKVVGKLEGLACKDPKKINSAGLIEAEVALEVILDFYEETLRSAAGLLTETFRYKEEFETL